VKAYKGWSDRGYALRGQFDARGWNLVTQKPTNEGSDNHRNESGKDRHQLGICADAEDTASKEWRHLDETKPEKPFSLLPRQRSRRGPAVVCGKVRMVAGDVSLVCECQLSEAIPMQYDV
jgi:hypothetical protein